MVARSCACFSIFNSQLKQYHYGRKEEKSCSGVQWGA